MTYPYPENPQHGAHLPVPGQQATGHPQFGHPMGHYGPPVAARPIRSAGAAVALELVLGLFGIFGVGNIYAGRAGLGVALMISFWVLFWINIVLMFLVIGWFTMPLTWIAYLVAGPMLAARAVENHNAGY